MLPSPIFSILEIAMIETSYLVQKKAKLGIFFPRGPHYYLTKQDNDEAFQSKPYGVNTAKLVGI